MNEFDTRLKAMAGAENCLVPGGFEDRVKQQLEELDEAKGKKLCPARWGLAAACLCAALVGTAFAVETEIGQKILRYISGGEFDKVLSEIDPNHQPSGEDYTGIVLDKEEMGISLDGVSAEALSLAGGAGAMEFASFAEAEEFLGIDIYDNAVMEAVAGEEYSGPELYEDGGLERVRLDRDVGAHLLCCADDQGMTWIQTTHYAMSGDLKLSAVITASVEAERFVNGEGASAVVYPAENELTEESYTAAWGEVVPIVRNVYPGENGSARYTEYSSHFVVKGVRYWVTVGGEGSADGGAERIREVLDAFVFQTVS